MRIAEVPVGRRLHVRVRLADPHEEGRAEGDDREDRQEAVEGAADLAEGIAPEGAEPHHSIASTGTGSALRMTLSTRPLRNRTTRSAVGAIARLCVITTTVVPVRRQVS